MSKLKAGKCVLCRQPLFRHDPNRQSLKVGKGSSGQGAYKEAHLACAQMMRLKNDEMLRKGVNNGIS